MGAEVFGEYHPHSMVVSAARYLVSQCLVRETNRQFMLSLAVLQNFLFPFWYRGRTYLSLRTPWFHIWFMNPWSGRVLRSVER